MPEETLVFQIQGVRIAYGLRPAVDNLSLSLKAGKSLGLLGVNGAGKTSTIRALLGMLKPRQGELNIFGFRPGDYRAFSKIGFAPEDGVPPEYLSGREYLRFVGAFRVRDRSARNKEADELIEWFELQPEKKIRDYSKGMKRRLVLAQAFLGNPPFLILDEPLNGLDPLVIIKLRDRLDAYRRQGGTILYSSHILAEVEKTCTDIAILSKGNMVADSSTEAMIREFGSVEGAFASKVGMGS